MDLRGNDLRNRQGGLGGLLRSNVTLDSCGSLSESVSKLDCQWHLCIFCVPRICIADGCCTSPWETTFQAGLGGDWVAWQFKARKVPTNNGGFCWWDISRLAYFSYFSWFSHIFTYLILGLGPRIYWGRIPHDSRKSMEISQQLSAAQGLGTLATWLHGTRGAAEKLGWFWIILNGTWYKSRLNGNEIEMRWFNSFSGMA